MSIAPSQICEALKLFSTDKAGLHICSRFFDLPFRSHPQAHKIDAAASGITHDLWNISTLAQRIEWSRQLSISGQLSPTTWSMFASLDIEQTLVQARSIMDHVAEVIRYASSKKEQTPESFRELRQSIAKHAHRLPNGVAPLIKNADWFDSLRAVRDSLVHRGANSSVFGEPHDGILFQVFGARAVRHIDIEQCMHNQNVARFDRYLALLIANILVFLENLGEALEPHFPSREGFGPARLYSPGFEQLRNWMAAFGHHENT